MSWSSSCLFSPLFIRWPGLHGCTPGPRAFREAQQTVSDRVSLTLGGYSGVLKCFASTALGAFQDDFNIANFNSSTSFLPSNRTILRPSAIQNISAGNDAKDLISTKRRTLVGLLPRLPCREHRPRWRCGRPKTSHRGRRHHCRPPLTRHTERHREMSQEAHGNRDVQQLRQDPVKADPRRRFPVVGATGAPRDLQETSAMMTQSALWTRDGSHRHSMRI